ncbi:MAG: ABC transporter permease [Candidatus Aminicenantes bacterium]|nr:MAG: ABC transporter permease [Candidatus Aminicenantes bacterium]
MRKILAVIKREYIQMVRTKGFIIGTVLGPVGMIALIVVPIVVSSVSVEKQETIGVVDLTNEIFMELDKKLDHKDYRLKDGFRRYVLEKFEPSAGTEELRHELREKVLKKELSAYIYIPEDVLEIGARESAVRESEPEQEKVEYVSDHTTDFEKLRALNRALNNVVIEKRLKREGLDPQKVAQYIKRVELQPIKITKKGEEKDTGGTFMISYILALIIYMAILIYGQVIMRGVIEEKSSRVVEVVLSSLRPFQLMMGKILGIGAVGLTQFSIWTLFGIGASVYGTSFIPAGANFAMPSIPAHVFVYFVVFFILGYFLFGTLYAAIGSLVNSEKEAQQLVMPVTMFLIVPIMLMIFIIRAPNSSIAVSLSFIPFFAPILMFLRITVLLPPFGQIGASIVILILTILFMIWLTAKIYRVGILMYGKRPKFAEIVRWIRYK